MLCRGLCNCRVYWVCCVDLEFEEWGEVSMLDIRHTYKGIKIQHISKIPLKDNINWNSRNPKLKLSTTPTRTTMPTKPPNQNIVRDRTLVLRILVPGLHTRLNDKINTLQEANSGSSTPVSGLGGAHNNNKGADKILDLDGVSCLPSSSGSTLWHFRWVCVKVLFLHKSDSACVVILILCPLCIMFIAWTLCRCDGATYPARLVNLPWWVSL